MRIVIGGDHAGFPLKSHLIPFLEALGHEVTDVGAFSEEPVDFPDVAKDLCGLILDGKADRGVMCCGTGVGAGIACNKIRGIRAALCHDTHCAHQCVEHDDVNVVAMGNWIIGRKLAEEIVTTFIEAEFDDTEDVRRRVAKLSELEEWGRNRS
ncbi:MAG: ribose 5-phosphate isomerase B [Candidatus Latescibacteria bacterium]|jgi:ribose 5-phosphate isomerase B|nr:ribose 5-phosphate isomerase B [Candidatus Latescibacterota bacterium]